MNKRVQLYILFVQLIMMLACLCRWRRRPYCRLSAEMSSVMRAFSEEPSCTAAALRGVFEERAPFFPAAGDDGPPLSRPAAV